MRSLIGPSWFAAVAVVAVTPLGVSAQVVQGRVIDAVRGGAVAGALIELRDTTGTVRARTMSGETGTFTLMPPVRDGLAIRVIAIGYAPRRWERLTGSPAEVRLTPHAVTLPAIRALADGKGCHGVGDADTYTRLFNAATDALEIMNATINSGSRRFEVVEEFRTMIDKRVVTSQTARRGLMEWPIGSIATDSLRDYGFAIVTVTDSTRGRMWHGPDLAVLFADWFQERYCFTVKEPDAKRDYIAIRFEPAKKSKLVELEGEIRLDPATLAVRELLYTHVNLPPGIAKGSAGGVVQFASDSTKTWVPVYWSIRAPMELPRPRAISRTVTTRGTGGLSMTPPPVSPGRINASVERVGRVLTGESVP